MINTLIVLWRYNTVDRLRGDCLKTTGCCERYQKNDIVERDYKRFLDDNNLFLLMLTLIPLCEARHLIRDKAE